MGDIGKPRRRVIRVPATPIRKPVQEPSPAPKPAPEPVREPARTGWVSQFPFPGRVAGSSHHPLRESIPHPSSTDRDEPPLITLGRRLHNPLCNPG